jgi:MFS transporter, putative metabolite:H+ symporter
MSTSAPQAVIPDGLPPIPSRTTPGQLTSIDVAARLDRLAVGGFHIRVLIVAALSLLFDTLDTVVTGFVLAALRSQWHFGTEVFGLVSAIGLTGYLCGSFFAGFAADKFGRKAVILWTLVLYSIFSAARGLTNDIVTFTVLNFFTWVFVGAESSTVPPYLAELWPTRVRGKLNGWMMGFFALGIALSPVWALLIIPSLGWRWALFLTAPFALVGGLMRSGLPESPRWLIQKFRHAEAEKTLQGIEARAKVISSSKLPAAPVEPLIVNAQARQYSARDLLGRDYRRITIMVWIAWLAEYGVLYTLTSFVPTMLALEGYSIVKSFQFSVAIYMSSVPGYIIGGYLVEVFDRKFVLMSAFFCAACFGTMFGLATTPMTIMIFGGLTTFSLAVGSTSIYTYTPELYPTEVRATAMGIASAWGRVGAVILLLVFGVFAAVKGKLFLFVISDAILFVAILAVGILGPRTRGRTLEQASAEARSR